MTAILDTTTLVLDARTSRIVHFTPLEPSALPTIDGNLLVSVPTASLPAALQPANSYTYTYKHGRITQDTAPPKVAPQSALEANRTALARQLHTRLRSQFERVHPWSPEANQPRLRQFARVETGFNARLAAATSQADIDALATDIAGLVVDKPPL